MADLSQYDDIFKAAGDEWNVDPRLLKAMATQESQGDPRAVSKKSAQGLMQITPDTQKALGVTDPTDPVQSIYGGAKYMNEALDAEGTPEKALLYYHGGPNWRDKYGPESQAYVPAVTAHYVALQPQQQADQQPQAVPAASTPAPAPSPASQSGPLILGDSLASKGGLGGTGVVGASPKAVLDSINGMPAEQVRGRDVVLSGGASNSPAQASLVYDQVQQLKAKGANSVTVVGVGDRPDFQGVNDQLALVSGRAGANFVPLDTTQLSPDRVHPTAQGYKTLLAAVTPKTATDASAAPASAPAAPQGQGKAMATDGLPSWLPPAPSAGGGASAPAATTGATSDGLPSWLPPAPKSSTPEQQEVPKTAQDVGTSDEQTAPAWMSQQSIPAVGPLTPGYVHGDILPLARREDVANDPNASWYQGWALQPPVRAFFEQPSELVTIDPNTNRLAAAPEAVTASSFVASPLKFSGGNALQPVPLGTLDRGAAPTPTGPITVNRLTQAMPPEAPAWRPVAPGEDYVPGAEYRMNQATGQREVNQGGPAAPATTTTSAAGQFLNNQWLLKAGDTGAGYDMGKGADALVSQVRDALARGDNVQLVADGGRKTVPITGINPQGMMVDAKGQPWGSFPIAADATGREGIRITPGAGSATPTGPQPGMGGPQPAGAQATPPAAATMTPEEIATQRTVADKQWLNQTQQPGVKDTTEHVPGITPNLVEQEQTVTAARELKALKNLNPELSQAERQILDRNTDLRKGFYADTVGSDVTRAADLKAANDKIETDLKQVWSGKGESDPANVQAAIKTELAGSAGDLPPMKSAMKQVSDSLENAGTDPQAMYRTHRLINYLQSKQGQLENPGYGAADVQAALTRVKGTLAQTIDNGAPGFKQAMSDYSTARGPIDAAKALQDRENGLYDSRGHMSFLKVHSLLRDIIDAQKWDAPNDPLAGVSDAQMARLKALHDDLKRTASAKDLATAQGSDTAMNAVDIAKAYGKLAGRAGIEGAANVAFGPGVGSMIVRGAENLLRPITSGVASRRQVRRGMQILQPPPSNPLNPP